MTDGMPEITMVQNGITPAGSTVRTVVTKEIIPNEVYMGKRSFGKESQDVIIETRTCDSEQRLDNILKTILSKRDKAKELRNIAFNSFYYDDARRAYIVSISPNATLQDVLSKCPFTIQEKGFLALDVCNEVKKIHSSSDVHNGLSLERVLVSDRDLIILTNYFNSIPSSVRDFLPEELIGLGSTIQGNYSKTRYKRESIDVFETALIMYQIFTGRKPGFLKEYKLTDEERQVLGQSLQTAPDSIGKCFRAFHNIGFNKRKAGDYVAVFPKMISALLSSGKMCGSYFLERVTKNTLKEYLVTVLDKSTLEEKYGSTEYLATLEKKSKKKYVFPFATTDIGGWYSKNGGRCNYVPILGKYFGFMKKPEERVYCPTLDELIEKLRAFDTKKRSDYYGRIYDLIGGKKGKNILNEMTELHVMQKKEQVKRERMSHLRKTSIAVTTFALTVGLLIAGYLQLSSHAHNVGRPSEGAAGIVPDYSQKKETIKKAVPAMPMPKSRLYIKLEDPKAYTVLRSKSARIGLRYLKFAILDSSNASTRISTDTLPLFRVTSLDKKFIVDYPHKLLISAKGQKLLSGLHAVKIEAYYPECKSLNTTITIMVVQPSILPTKPAVQLPALQTATPPRAIRPSASLLCSGVYKIEHVEKEVFLEDVWLTEKEKMVDEGGTIYLYKQHGAKTIAANPKEGTHLYFAKEYLLSKPQPVAVSNDDIISHDRRLLEKCLTLRGYVTTR